MAKMAGKGLTEKLMNGVYSSILTGSLMLTGCGTGGNPPTPALSQTATLTNDVDMDYTAEFSNMNNPVRSITHDGAQFGNDLTLPTSPYSETFNDLQKGKYVFSLRTSTPDVSPITTTREVPNYAPMAEFSLLNTDINENSQITINLESAFNDKNPEDNPVPLVGIIPLSGGLEVVSINGYIVIIKAPEIIDDNTPEISYELNVEFGDSAGGLESSVLTGKVINVPEQIAFRSFLAGNDFSICGLCDDIYIMDDNGENLRRLTTNKGEELEPTWSPDGTKIAYAGVSQSVGDGDPVNGNNGLFVINYDGIGEEQLYDTQGLVRYPDWSPDGTKIAFTYISPAEGRYGISVLDLESGVVTQLTSDTCPGCFANGSPSWSPDGSRIVFDAYRNNSNDIWIMNSDGTSQEKIYSGGMMPDWSPDGLEIVFVSPTDEPKIHIMKINDGSVTQIIKDLLFRNYHPDWSSDGNRIVFSGGTGTGLQIYIMNKDGSEQTHLPIPAHSQSPAWRPKPNQP